MIYAYRLDALSVLCAQLTRDMLAIAKFLLVIVKTKLCRPSCQKVPGAAKIAPRSPTTLEIGTERGTF